jgi:hypothetical protein
MYEQAAVLDLIESIKPRLVLSGHSAVFDDVAASLGLARQA